MKQKSKQRPSKAVHQKRIFTSLKFTVILATILVVLVATVTSSLIGYYRAKSTITVDANTQVNLALQQTVLSVQKSLDNNAKVAQTLARGVEAILTEGGNLQALPYLLESFLETNDETFGGGIWFEPYAVIPTLEHFSPYCMRENGEMKYFDNYNLGDGIYYTEQDWYTSGKTASSPIVWSAPYLDTFAGITMVTATAPIYDSTGRFLGVTTADIDLTSLQQTVSGMTQHESISGFVVDASGTYVADEDPNKSLKYNIKDDSNGFDKVAVQMLQNKQGSAGFEHNKEHSTLWYAQIPDVDWVAGIAVTDSYLYKNIASLKSTLTFASVLIAVLSCLGIYIFATLSVVKPVERLTRATREISAGNWNVSIQTTARGEMRELEENFALMTQKLQSYDGYINEIIEVLNQLSRGYLNFQLVNDYTGDFETIKKSLNRISNSFKALIGEIQKNADSFTQETANISNASHILSENALTQAASIQELSATIAQIAEHSRSTAEYAQEANAMANETGQILNNSTQQMQQMTGAMDKIYQASTEIDKVIKAIDDIAFQTNILSLNAAVEAARAGAAGKGFAVVADEVRNLAQKSAESAKNTAQLIQNAMDAVKEGKQIVLDTEHTIQEVAQATKKVLASAEDIAQASRDQDSNMHQITKGISDISNIVQTNTQSVQESAESAEQLSEQAQVLHMLVQNFRLD